MYRSIAALVTLAVAWSVLSAEPAAAGTEEDAEAVEQVLLELERSLEADLRAAEWDEPLPLEARIVRLQDRVERLSRRLFLVRHEARRALATLTPMVVVDHVERLETARRVPGMALDLVDSSDVAALESVLVDWVRLQDTLDRLALARDRLTAITGSDPVERVCPVAGRHTFENGWGDGRYGGRAHKGIDLEAEFGTPIVAVEDGVVVQAGWHWAGGIQAYLLGDATGDVTYYAHMSWWAPGIGVGSRVAAGDLLGWVGVSGNAESPHLHFGWMPATGAVDLEALDNPYVMLLEICGGAGDQ